MFSNRQVLFHAAALAFLIAPACSKQSEEDTKGSGATGNVTITGIGSTGNTGNSGSGGGVTGNEVGSVTQIPEDQVDELTNNACNAWAIEPESSPAKLQLVVDISSSMKNAAPGTNQSKWEVTRDALVNAICGDTAGNSPGLGANTAVGLMFYPNMVNDQVSTTPVDQSVCLNLGGITPMAQLGDNGANTQRTLLRTRLTDAVLGRGTPTADAYDYALNQIALSPEQQQFPGDTYMLLITDGMPTLYHDCYNPSGSLSNLPGDEVVALVDGAYARNVKSFIIGSPGSEQGVQWLSKAAYLGGTGKAGCNTTNFNAPYCHMDMTAATDFSAALREGLQQVAVAVSGCKFEVPKESADGSKTVDPNAVVPIVIFGDGHAELVGRDSVSGDNCTEGFQLINNNAQVQLCPATCSRFQGDSNATLRLLFGCTKDELISTIQ